MKTKYTIVSLLLISLMITFIGCGKSDNSNTKIDDTNKNVKQVQYQDAPKAGDIGVEESSVDTTVTTTTPTTTKSTTTKSTTTTAQTSVTTTGTTAKTIPTLGLGETFTYKQNGRPVYSIKIISIKETDYRDINSKLNPVQILAINFILTNISNPIKNNFSFICEDSQHKFSYDYPAYSIPYIKMNDTREIMTMIGLNNKTNGNIKLYLKNYINNNSTIEAIFDLNIN